MISVYVFQSTHPRGVRLNPTKSIERSSTGFNPRTHEGCDHRSPLRMVQDNSFNPRTHEGCDEMQGTELADEGVFQSTHPRGVRLQTRKYYYQEVGFNPRTHEGCDSIAGCRDSLSKVSIHAPTRGATDAFCCIKDNNKVSIHAPTRGATDIS